MKIKLLLCLGIISLSVIGGVFIYNKSDTLNTQINRGHKLEQSVIDYLNDKNEFSSDWEFKEETNTLYIKFYDSFFENNDKTKNTLLECKERVIEEVVKHGGRDDINISFIINNELYNF